MFTALLVFSLVSSTLAGDEYHPRISPRFYNSLEQPYEYKPHYPIVGDEKYPQQYPEIDKDQDLQQALLQLQQDNPLDHYPYVKDPFDGFGPSSQENSEEHHSDPLAHYPYAKDPYNGEGQALLQLQQDDNPLDHYPYVKDPFDGFGPSSHEKHEEHHSNPLDHYPYEKDPYQE